MTNMRPIIVLGGSVTGLLCGMQLAGRGYDVTILERDSHLEVASPATAPLAVRPGAPQAVHGHGLLARFSVELRRTFPAVYESLLAAGVGQCDLVKSMPPAITDRTARDGDDDLVMLQTCRQTLDRVLVNAALETPRLNIRFGTSAVNLHLTDSGHGAPRVTGVETANGDTLQAELVIDASGRRSPVPRWLAAHGIELPLEAWDCGLVYYTRHYRLRPGAEKPALNRIFAAGGLLPSLSMSWFPGDNETAMLVQSVLPEDHLLKAVRRPAEFELVARSVPSVAAWRECADPISEVFAMGALQNTFRQVVQRDRPLVLGLHLIGDAACTTNPRRGRGISLAAITTSGLMHAIEREPDDVAAQAIRHRDVVAREVEPHFRENVLSDLATASQMRADLAGTPPPEPTFAADSILFEELMMAGMQDADLYRTAMRYAQLLGESALLNDPNVVDRVRSFVPEGTPMRRLAGPTRFELTQLLSAT